MSLPVFPLQNEQDSTDFSISQSDNAVVGELEGGYKHTRPRTTRKPRKTFSTGFTEISQIQLDLLMEFYDEVGKFMPFTWTHPIKGDDHKCRIVEWPEAKYAGHGQYKVYNLKGIKLEEV